MAAATTRSLGFGADVRGAGRPRSADKTYPIFQRALAHTGQEHPTVHYKGDVGDYCVIDGSAAIRPFSDIPGKTIGIYNDIVGLSTAGVMFTGAGALADIHARRVAAEKRGDHGKALVERINEVGMAGLTAGGVAFMAYRPLAVAAQLKGQAISPHATEALGRVAYGAGQAGSVCFGLFYAVNVKNALTALFKETWFRFNLWRKGEAFLREQLEPAMVKDDPEAFRKRALEHGDQWLERVFDEMKEEGILPPSFKSSKEERKRIFERMMGEDARLVGFGRRLMLTNAQANKDACLRSIVGKKCFAILKGDAAMDVKIATIHQKFNLMHTLKAVVVFFLAVTGILWVVFSFINNPVTNVSYGTQSGAYFLIDLKKFIKWCKNGTVGKWDKAITIGMMVLLAASVAAMIAFPPFLAIPMALTIAMFAMQGLWLAFSAVKLYFILKKERETPTLEGFIRFVKTHPTKQKAQELLSKLPEIDRLAIVKACDDYRVSMGVMRLKREPNQYELLSGAEYLLAKRQSLKREILTELRNAMSPMLKM